jgi:hypothetical protein
MNRRLLSFMEFTLTVLAVMCGGAAILYLVAAWLRR